MLQTLVVGLVEGGVYSLSAVGLVLIFSVAGVANLAHGEAVMLGGLVAYTGAAHWGLPYAVDILIGGVAAAALGVLFSVVVFDRLRDQAEEGFLIASLALIFIIESMSTSIFGEEPKSLPNAPGHVFVVGGAHITTAWLAIIVVGVVLSLGLRLYISKTGPGRAMRAMALNPYAATLMGIPRRRYSNLAFAIGSLLAGIAGGLLASAFPISPTSGEDIAFKAFIVIIFAGMGSIGGALLGGMILGIVGAFSAGYISSGYSNTFIFLFLLLVLLIRPNGMFGVSIARD